MRRLSSIAVLVAAVSFAACSSSATSAPAAGGATMAPAATTAPESASSAPVASAPASAAAESAVPSIDTSAFGSKYSQISQELQAATAAIMSKLTSATSPADIAAVYKELAAAMKKAIAEYRAVDWPAAIKGDILQALNDEEELVGIYEKVVTDPTAMVANQARLTQLTNDLEALGKKIAAYFGQP
jgi:hypothetical protein